MVVDKVGINAEFWGSKTLKEFKEAFKGKLRSDKIEEVYKSLPKPPKAAAKKKPKPAVVKEEREKIDEVKVEETKKESIESEDEK